MAPNGGSTTYTKSVAPAPEELFFGIGFAAVLALGSVLY